MELHQVATDGIVSTRQAASLGLGPPDLRALVSSGTLRRLVRGWYAVRSPDDDRPPWEGADHFESVLALHRLTTMALLRSFDGRVCASQQSALVLHGIALWRSDLSTVHVARTTDDHTRHRTGAIIHPSCGVDPVTTSGHLTVPVAVAVVQVGLRLMLGRAVFPLESLVAADSALHRQAVTRAELDEAVTLHAGHPASAQ